MSDPLVHKVMAMMIIESHDRVAQRCAERQLEEGSVSNLLPVGIAMLASSSQWWTQCAISPLVLTTSLALSDNSLRAPTGALSSFNVLSQFLTLTQRNSRATATSTAVHTSRDVSLDATVANGQYGEFLAVTIITNLARWSRGYHRYFQRLLLLVFLALSTSKATNEKAVLSTHYRSYLWYLPGVRERRRTSAS